MSWLNKVFGSRKSEPEVIKIPITVDNPKSNKFAALNGEDSEHIYAYSNKDYSFSGDIKELDIDGLLSAPQSNIQTLFELAYYYSNADPIVHAIVYNVMVPYLISSNYYLTCTNKKTIDIFNRYYDKIRLREKIESIFTELAIYNNVYIYVYNGSIITLPHNICHVVNTTLDGKPIVEVEVQQLKYQIPQKSYTVDKEFVKDSDPDYVVKGYPEEIQKAIKDGAQYAQLRPEYTFCIQGSKESYVRYALPWLTSALPALQRKAYLKTYELAQLSIGSTCALHIQYGDSKSDVLPTRDELILTRKAFLNGLKAGGSGIVVTNQLAQATIINQQVNDLYQYPLYEDVNQCILSAAGVAGIIASGASNTNGTYASAAAGEKALEIRLERMRREFEDVMSQINAVLVQFMPETYNLKTIPQFHFSPISMSGKKALREECLALFDKQLVSKSTVDELYGYNYEAEKEMMNSEGSVKKTETKTKTTETKETTGDVGRPVLDDDERVSSPENSESGNPQAKL